MTTLTIEREYVEALSGLGKLDEVVKQALHEYALTHVQRRIDKAQQNIAIYEEKYSLTYQQFTQQITTDEQFVEQTEANYLMWEMDWHSWEYYVQELETWRGRLKQLSKL